MLTSFKKTHGLLILAISLAILAPTQSRAANSCWLLSYIYNNKTTTPEHPDKSGFASLILSKPGGAPPTWDMVRIAIHQEAVKTLLIGNNPNNSATVPISVSQISCQKN